MSSLTSSRQNLAVNLLLAILAIGLAVATYLVFINWQQSTPAAYTKSASADQSTIAVQLQDHLKPSTYQHLTESINNYLSSDVNLVTIRPDTYSEKDQQIEFLTDISGSSASYRFVIDTKSDDVSIRCPKLDERRDQSWSCVPLTGDSHEH